MAPHLSVSQEDKGLVRLTKAARGAAGIFVLRQEIRSGRQQDGKAAESRQPVQTLRDWRPRGWFETLAEGQRFHVKQLQVDPGHRLSLQKHCHRSEHRVVVEGTDTVTRGEETFLLLESESAFIPAGTQHRLANEGKLPLKIVEIRVGDCFGEDDIIRLTDDFGRKAGSDGEPSS